MIEKFGNIITSMTPQEAIEILKRYNAWRRDENVPNSHEMPDPKEVGIAIDTAVDFISELIRL